MKLQSFILSVMLIGSISINAFCQNNSTNELGEAINRPIELSPSMFSSNLPGKDGEGFDKLKVKVNKKEEKAIEEVLDQII